MGKRKPKRSHVQGKGKLSRLMDKTNRRVLASDKAKGFDIRTNTFCVEVVDGVKVPSSAKKIG
jgi:hypothetical protein